MNVSAAAAGALLGFGVWLGWTGLRPARPPLHRALAALHPPAAAPASDPAETPPDAGLAGGGWAARAGRRAGRALAVSSLISRRIRRDLTVLDRPVDVHAAEKVTGAVAGLLLPPAVAVVLTVAGHPLGWALPVGGTLVLAAVGFGMPDVAVHADAERRRRDHRQALSAFLDLTVVSLAGGAGIEQALTDAAGTGDSLLFTRIRQTLDGAALSRTPPWAALARLGRHVDLPDLVETAAAVSLAGTEGATVRASLQAKAAAVRAHQLTDTETLETAASERMALPVVVLFAGFLLFLGYPAVAHILTSL